MSLETCERCCEWVHDNEDKSPLTVADSYSKMMAYVLRHEFHMSKGAAKAFVDEACCGNWERMHETNAEKALGAKDYAELLRGDVWYCSDRWSWDRVIRVQWLYKRLRDRVEEEVCE